MSAKAAEHSRRKILALAWSALICIEITTQLSLKFAGRYTGHFDFTAHAFELAVGCGWLWLALTSYCAGFIAWMLILGRSDLSRAYPTSAIVFVAVMLASWLVLREPIGTIQWIGAAVIVAGILQLGHAEPAASSERSPAPVE